MKSETVGAEVMVAGLGRDEAVAAEAVLADGAEPEEGRSAHSCVKRGVSRAYRDQTDPKPRPSSPPWPFL
jgi:hypothetical protein